VLPAFRPSQTTSYGAVIAATVVAQLSPDPDGDTVGSPPSSMAAWGSLRQRPARSSNCSHVGVKKNRTQRSAVLLACKPGGQLSFAPSRIQARMAFRSHDDNCFFPCGIRSCGEARQSSSNIRLLLSGSPGMTIGPNLVPFITPA
jgi:hypothetical protein